ncbi:HAD family hydrolase [Eionea flava]
MHKMSAKKEHLFAFFDVDDTIISTKSMMGFIALYFTDINNENLKNKFYTEVKELTNLGASWETMNEVYYSYFKNFSTESVKKIANLWFFNNIEHPLGFYHKNIVKILKEHQSNGIECVFVSGSFQELLQPIADDLGVKHILSINLERKEGKYTGNIIPPQTIGTGKADAMRLFIEDKECLLSDCYAYGDDISDVPMLSIVGNPVAVTGGRRLESYAKEHGWATTNPN